MTRPQTWAKELIPILQSTADNFDNAASDFTKHAQGLPVKCKKENDVVIDWFLEEMVPLINTYRSTVAAAKDPWSNIRCPVLCHSLVLLHFPSLLSLPTPLGRRRSSELADAI